MFEYWLKTTIEFREAIWARERKKGKEIENWEKYAVFEEVENEGQETVGLIWVITRKKADGQKF